jgi:hypothetical protein
MKVPYQKGDKIVVRRVFYSKGSPSGSTEYRLIKVGNHDIRDGPVGTRAELKAWCAEKGIPMKDVRFQNHW